MGKHTNGPQAWVQRRASTVFVRVPVSEWSLVKRGQKREFRANPSRTSHLIHLELPRAVVAWSVGRGTKHDSRLMVLTEMWREPQGAISEESLAEEGCASLAEFRRKMTLRQSGRFKPMKMMTVFRVRLWEESDEAEQGQIILHHIYGPWLRGEEGR